jgi:PEGA domain-containing protein
MKMTIGLTAALLTMGIASVPAYAQERDNHRREAARAEQSHRGESQPSQARGSEQAQPRRQEAPRVQAPPAAAAPRVQPVRPPANAQQRVQPVQPPAAAVPAPRADTRQNEVVGRAVPRTAPNWDRDRHNDNDRRYDNEHYRSDGHHYGYAYPRYYSPRVVVRPYVFRPHLSIGFGIFAGYPVPYSWRYSYPIAVYGYRAPAAPVYITPGSPYYGGVALEMSPYDADVWVDGNYAGKVQDFDGTQQPLTLVAGTHRIEVQAPGYAPLIFDVNVVGGEVIPYRGDLRPY